MNAFVLATILLGAVYAEEEIDLEMNLGDLPMQNPDLFQGDIIGIDSVDDKNAIPHEEMRWRNKEVPYVIDSSLILHAGVIKESMENYHRSTCIKFVPRNNEQNYIRLFAGSGCYSNVGMIGGQQPVSLGQGCIFIGTIVHELGHALGFFHEQNRSDRDNFLIIYWQNIMQGMDNQFFLLKYNENLLLNDFCYDSIMLYGNTAFSKDGTSPTMVAKNGQKLLETYDKPGLAPCDIERVKKMYKC